MIGSVLKRVNPRVVLVLLAALSVAFVSSVIAGDSKSKEESLDGYAAAIEIASKNAEVKSEADLVINMKNENSPLHALTEKGFRQFVSGLTFTEHGLGSLNYEPLVNELDEEGIYQIMKLFGVQFESSLYSDDHCCPTNVQNSTRACCGLGGLGLGGPELNSSIMGLRSNRLS